mmetsp:Transcript_100970/g.290404  ORF Transcript_100970/g.290404 Transcript_100970/m.290404 type:complete len:768 (-) Transcript_100970:1052-3355(-)
MPSKRRSASDVFLLRDDPVAILVEGLEGVAAPLLPGDLPVVVPVDGVENVDGRPAHAHRFHRNGLRRHRRASPATGARRDGCAAGAAPSDGLEDEGGGACGRRVARRCRPGGHEGLRLHLGLAPREGHRAVLSGARRRHRMSWIGRRGMPWLHEVGHGLGRRRRRREHHRLRGRREHHGLRRRRPHHRLRGRGHWPRRRRLHQRRHRRGEQRGPRRLGRRGAEHGCFRVGHVPHRVVPEAVRLAVALVVGGLLHADRALAFAPTAEAGVEGQGGCASAHDEEPRQQAEHPEAAAIIARMRLHPASRHRAGAQVLAELVSHRAIEGFPDFRGGHLFRLQEHGVPGAPALRAILLRADEVLRLLARILPPDLPAVGHEARREEGFGAVAGLDQVDRRRLASLRGMDPGTLEVVAPANPGELLRGLEVDVAFAAAALADFWRLHGVLELQPRIHPEYLRVAGALREVALVGLVGLPGHALPEAVRHHPAHEVRSARHGPMPVHAAALGVGLRHALPLRVEDRCSGRLAGNRHWHGGRLAVRAHAHTPGGARGGADEGAVAAVDGEVVGGAQVLVLAGARRAAAPDASLVVHLQAGVKGLGRAVPAGNAGRLVGELAAPGVLEAGQLLGLLHLLDPLRRVLARGHGVGRLGVEGDERSALAVHNVVEGLAKARAVGYTSRPAAPNARLPVDPEAVLVLGDARGVVAVHARADVLGGRTALRQRVQALEVHGHRLGRGLPNGPLAAPLELLRRHDLAVLAGCRGVDLLGVEG